MKYSYKYFMDGKKEESTISFNEDFPAFDIINMLEIYAKEKKIHNAKDLLVENDIRFNRFYRKASRN